jgi:hypothetical protein
MLSCGPHRTDLQNRLTAVRGILDATHSSNTPPSGLDISREARGMSVVLLYAAYENLLVSLCRSLLETAIQLRVGNRRLKPGLQVFAAYNKLQAITSVTPPKLWGDFGFDLIDTLTSSNACTISPELFPNDGSNMRRSQVTTFCRVFNLGDPAPVLREVWSRLDTIVTERNGIAHGRLTPDEVGRNYSITDMMGLVAIWDERWNDFLTWVEGQASTRDFFRTHH